MISQLFINNLINRIDIVHIISDYISLKKSGSNFVGLCPFHDEKTPSFTVYPIKKFYYCFGCGIYGDAIQFLINYLGFHFVESVNYLKKNIGIYEKDEKNYYFNNKILSEKSSKYSHIALTNIDLSLLKKIMICASNFYKIQLKNSKEAVNFLKNRGLNKEIILRFNLGYAPNEWNALNKVFLDYNNVNILTSSGLIVDKIIDKVNQSSVIKKHKRYDRFRGRIMFPIKNIDGQIIGFGGRLIKDSNEAKYINSPETPLFHKSNELYGLFEAKNAIKKSGYVLVTEGYMDVIGLSQFGFLQTVAILGTTCTSTHIKKILFYTNCIIFSFDGDQAGRRAARRALEVCLIYATDDKIIKFLFLPVKYDPDSYIRKFGSKIFSKKILEAMSLLQFFLEEIIVNYNLKTIKDIEKAKYNIEYLFKIIPLSSSLKFKIISSLSKVTKSSFNEINNLFKINTLSIKSIKQKNILPMCIEHQIMRLLISYPSLINEINSEDMMIFSKCSPNYVKMFSQLINTIYVFENNIDYSKFIEHLKKININFESIIFKIKNNFEYSIEIAKKILLDAIYKIKIRILNNELNDLIKKGSLDEQSKIRYRNIISYKKKLEYKKIK
ncbi:DNA primase [Candidatus Profftella armatura (Diaphorina cf. continua)]|uniref:DNA primase n=1 Tax=Candidatus Profftella armatura (Diaphorina cf. continua) TaxID=2661583 RepID=A0A7R7ABV1_9PROT|nr:DNA primase [Candidatus Profftella armatura (Diaphorina cf. continua)]BCG49771.1 DNA primase [Candidatus Profftella armatura (Diaphorina cf. continua)]